jgi:hypothetical protein
MHAIPLTLPLHAHVPLHPALRLPCASCGFTNETLAEITARGYLCLVDIVALEMSELLGTFSSDAVKDIISVMSRLCIHIGELPFNRILAKNAARLQGITAELIVKMSAEFVEQFSKQVGSPPVAVGSLTLLSLAIHHGFGFSEDEKRQVNLALLPYGLRCDMTLDQIFQGPPVASQPPLTKKQLKTCELEARYPVLSPEGEDWVRSHTDVLPQVIHIWLAVMAVSDPPDELVQWFVSKNMPLQRISSADLERVMKLIKSE